MARIRPSKFLFCKTIFFYILIFQTVETSVVFPESPVNMKKITIIALSSDRILGYASTNFSYGNRSDEAAITEVEHLRLLINKKGKEMLSFLTWNYYLLFAVVTTNLVLFTIGLWLRMCRKNYRNPERLHSDNMFLVEQ